MNDREQYLLTALEAIYDEIVCEKPCYKECDDCPVLESFSSIIENMRQSSSESITKDLGMKPVDWSKCHKKRSTPEAR